MLNIKELTKSMYPNYLFPGNENLAFDPRQNKTIKDAKYICYMFYYLEDDNYSVMFVREKKK